MAMSQKISHARAPLYLSARVHYLYIQVFEGYLVTEAKPLSPPSLRVLPLPYGKYPHSIEFDSIFRLRYMEPTLPRMNVFRRYNARVTVS